MDNDIFNSNRISIIVWFLQRKWRLNEHYHRRVNKEFNGYFCEKFDLIFIRDFTFSLPNDMKSDERKTLYTLVWLYYRPERKRTFFLFHSLSLHYLHNFNFRSFCCLINIDAKVVYAFSCYSMHIWLTNFEMFRMIHFTTRKKKASWHELFVVFQKIRV
jgi:hypothetical protein